jgi:hypothetical protein
MSFQSVVVLYLISIIRCHVYYHSSDVVNVRAVMRGETREVTPPPLPEAKNAPIFLENWSKPCEIPSETTFVSTDIRSVCSVLMRLSTVFSAVLARRTFLRQLTGNV